MRTLPEVPLSPCSESDARLLVQNFDLWQEAIALTPSPALVELLEKAQADARDMNDALDGMVDVTLGAGEVFKCHATGAKGGFRWRIENDDFLIMIGSPRRTWTISIRYLSGGLWEHGIDALRARAFAALSPYTTNAAGDDCIRVSRVDYCFDFYSPAFTKEFRPGLAANIVCHSSAKAHEAGGDTGGYNLWAANGRGQTLTCGSKSGAQVQIYDKTLEIDEQSGKTWLYAVWVAGLDGEWVWETDKVTDVWRLELRWSSDYLKERNIRRPHEVIEHLAELIAELLFTRRLAVPTGDSNRRRWPLHAIWSEAYRSRGAPEMLPIGRRVTGRRAALIDAAQASLAGNFRSLAVLENGEWSRDVIVAHVEKALTRVLDDPRHKIKEERAHVRYRDVEDAK